MAKESNIAAEGSGDPEPLLILVGSRIRAARRHARLKQSDLAKAIGTGQSYIVGVEAGEQNITLKVLARVAAALGVPPVSFFLESEPMAASDEGVASQLSEVLAAAMHDTDRLADFLRQAHALVAGGSGNPNPGSPPQPS